MRYVLQIDYSDYDGRVRYFRNEFAHTPCLCHAAIKDSKREWFEYLDKKVMKRHVKITLVNDKDYFYAKLAGK